MADSIPDKGAAELRSLRKLITSPTQQAVDELRRVILRLHAEIHTPDELNKLLVPVIADVLRQKVALQADDVSRALAPIIDKSFHERTEQDKSAVVHAIAPSVAKALREQHEKFPEEVAEDLAPLMGAAIREQVRLQRDAMVDALYPIIGATIAKYMAEALRELIENINKKVERTISIGGFMRRIKAKATGVSEAELLLQESLPFRAHAAFLIHKSSGILLAQASGPHSRNFDTDLVSGMLTAIRSFVNDWIARSGDISEIDAIEYGRSKIMLEVAGHCYLAVVVEGEPPRAFVEKVRSALSQIVARHDREISDFQGDHATMPEEISAEVQSILQEEHGAGVQKKPYWKTFLPAAAVVLAILGIPFGWSWYRANQNRQAEESVAAAIASSLGYSTNPVTVNVHGDDINLSGTLPNALLERRALRAAAETVPTAVLHDAITVGESPAHPVLAAAELERVTSVFNKIKGVSISSGYTNGVVSLRGVVNDDNLARKIVTAFERLPGVSTLEYSFSNRKATVEEIIYFDQSGSEISDNERRKLEQVKNFMSLFPAIQLRVTGYSDGIGSRERNIPLSLARAAAVKDTLVAMGIPESRLLVEGDGNPVPGLDPNLPENRCVRFEIIEPQDK